MLCIDETVCNMFLSRIFWYIVYTTIYSELRLNLEMRELMAYQIDIHLADDQ
jgi:hypothetical protein